MYMRRPTRRFLFPRGSLPPAVPRTLAEEYSWYDSLLLPSLRWLSLDLLTASILQAWPWLLASRPLGHEQKSLPYLSHA